MGIEINHPSVAPQDLDSCEIAFPVRGSFYTVVEDATEVQAVSLPH